MRIQVSVTGVDGETFVAMTSPHPLRVREFLTEHDHEGSSVVITVRAEDEEASRLLATLEEVRSALRGNLDA